MFFFFLFNKTHLFQESSKLIENIKTSKFVRATEPSLGSVGEQAKLCAVSQGMLPRTRRQLLKEPSTWTAASPSGFWSNLIP